MTRVKKSAEGAGAENLDILAARLQVMEVEYFGEPYTVDVKNGGHSFESDPNVNCRIKVVKNLVEPGQDEGAQFYDRFKLKRDKNGDWIFAKYSKLGSLMTVLYGEDWFTSDEEFNEEDLENFEFVAQVKPKQDRKGNTIPGSTVQWDTMRPAGGADEKPTPAAVAAESYPNEDDDDEGYGPKVPW
jgi:hypothetical protein